MSKLLPSMHGRLITHILKQTVFAATTIEGRLPCTDVQGQLPQREALRDQRKKKIEQRKDSDRPSSIEAFARMVDASDDLMTMGVYPPCSISPFHASNEHAQRPLIKQGKAIYHCNVLCTMKSTANIYIQPIREVKNYPTTSPKPAGDRQTPPTPCSKYITHENLYVHAVQDSPAVLVYGITASLQRAKQTAHPASTHPSPPPTSHSWT